MLELKYKINIGHEHRFSVAFIYRNVCPKLSFYGSLYRLILIGQTLQLIFSLAVSQTVGYIWSFSMATKQCYLHVFQITHWSLLSKQTHVFWLKMSVTYVTLFPWEGEWDGVDAMGNTFTMTGVWIHVTNMPIYWPMAVHGITSGAPESIQGCLQDTSEGDVQANFMHGNKTQRFVPLLRTMVTCVT